MINNNNFSDDLKRALAIAPPPPAGLDVIDSITKSSPVASVVVNPQADLINKSNAGNQGVYVIVGIVIALLSYGVYKEFIEPRLHKEPVTNSSMEVSVIQPENMEKAESIVTDSNNSAQDFFHTSSNNS